MGMVPDNDTSFEQCSYMGVPDWELLYVQIRVTGVLLQLHVQILNIYKTFTYISHLLSITAICMVSKFISVRFGVISVRFGVTYVFPVNTYFFKPARGHWDYYYFYC